MPLASLTAPIIAAVGLLTLYSIIVSCLLLVKHWGCLYSKMKDAPPLPHLSLSKLGFLFHSCKQNNINIGFLFHYKTPLWALCFIVIHQKESRTEKHRPANLLTAFCYFLFVSLKKASVCAFVR